MPELQVLRVFCGEDTPEGAGGSGGNPLGVFLAGAEIAQPKRQAVAKELGFSETVFVDDPAGGELQIFTPAVELPSPVTRWSAPLGCSPGTVTPQQPCGLPQARFRRGSRATAPSSPGARSGSPTTS